MAGQTLVAADAVLMDDYGPDVVRTLNNSNTIQASIKHKTEYLEGRRFVRPMHTKRNSGRGNRAESANLPPAGRQGYADLIGPVRYCYASIELTGPALATMKGRPASFVNGLEEEMTGAKNDATRDHTRQMWGTSDGKIATCGVTANSTTVVLAATTKMNQMLWLEDGPLIDIGTAANPTSVASAREVLSVDYDNKTITISGANVTTAGTDFIWASGAAGTSNNTGNPGDGQIELTGIKTQVAASGILFTVDPATQPRHKSKVYANGGTLRAISENLVTKALMDTQIASGRFVDLLVGSAGVFRAYGNLLTGMKRVVQDVTLPGGYAGLEVNAVGYGGPGEQTRTKQMLTWDRDCWDNELYGFATDTWECQLLEDWGWMDQDGRVLRKVSGKDVWEANLYSYRDYTCVQRNANFVIQDLQEQ